MTKKEKEKFPYIQDNRLSDVVTLIAFLAAEPGSGFWKTISINNTIGGPKSSTSWFLIAKEHREFFKLKKEELSQEKIFQKEGTIILLLRFLNQSEKDKEIYLPLEIEETQKLFDTAIALHNSQLSSFQRNSFKIPILTTLIASIVSLLSTTLTLTWVSNKNADIDIVKKLDSIATKIDSVQFKTNTNTLKTIILDTTKASK